MVLKQIKTCCQVVEGSLNGEFGWFWDVGTIVLILVLFNFGFKRLLLALQSYFKEHKNSLQESFVSSLYLPCSYYVWFFAVIEILDFTALQLFSKSYLPEKSMLLAVGVVAALTWFLMRWKKTLIEMLSQKQIGHRSSFGPTHFDLVNKLATVIIFFVASMLLLEITGSNLNTLIAFGGISGLAIAFASQEVVASFFGGLMIYITQPFTIGDWVNLPEKNIEGHVEEIGWYTTKVRTFEKCPIYIPNAIFSKIVVVNPSRMTHRRIKETIGVRYSDVAALKNIIADLKGMLNINPSIDKTMSTHAYFTTFGASSLDITLSAYTRETTAQGFYLIKEEILFSVIEILDRHGAQLAFSTLTLDFPEEKKEQIPGS